MPVRIICRQCKAVLYENPELVSPKDIIDKYDSKCPKCSAPLDFDATRLSISVSEGQERHGLLRIFQK
ncbi:MAG: hypothetical protein ABSF36_04600 [Candidatus Methanomethylicaceae archaeon]